MNGFCFLIQPASLTLLPYWDQTYSHAFPTRIPSDALQNKLIYKMGLGLKKKKHTSENINLQHIFCDLALFSHFCGNHTTDCTIWKDSGLYSPLWIPHRTWESFPHELSIFNCLSAWCSIHVSFTLPIPQGTSLDVSAQGKLCSITPRYPVPSHQIVFKIHTSLCSEPISKEHIYI